jgi:AcrR family transcriptional regulator
VTEVSVQWDSKGLEKAEKIGRVAAKLFSRKGYLETSMDEIAAGAKVSKGGMYYYFPSKTDVLFFILSNYMDLILGRVDEGLNQIRDADEKLKFIISKHIELYSDNMAEAKVLLHEAHCLPPKKFKAIAEKERQYYRIVSSILPTFIHERVSKDRLPALTFSLFGMCNWIYSWYNPKGPVTPEELSDIIYNIFTRGVTKFQ